MDEIIRRLEALATLDATQVAELAADIRSEYDTLRAGTDGVVDLVALENLTAALAYTTARADELTAEQAEADEILARLDAEMSGEPTVEMDAADAEALAALSDDERTALAENTPEEWAAYAELTAIDTTPPDAGDAAPTEPVVEPTQRAASAPRTVRVPVPSPIQPEPGDTSTAGIHSFTGGPDSPMITPVRAVELLRRTASAQRGPGQTPVLTVDVSDQWERVPAGNEVDIDEMLNRQQAALRAHRQASAAAGNVRQASGTLCAPERVLYGTSYLGNADAPLDGLFPALAESAADAAKSIKYTLAFDRSDFDDIDPDTGVGIDSATATENASGVNYPKTGAKIDCPTFVTSEQRGVWLELIFDNLNSMAWPEFQGTTNDAGQSLLAARLQEFILEDWYRAALAQSNVLAPIATQPYNAEHSLIYTILAVVAADRDDTRGQNVPYVVAAPIHLQSQLATEVAAQFNLGGDLTGEDARRELMQRANVTVEWYIDRFGVTPQAYETADGSPTKMVPVRGSSNVPLFPCEARIGIARDDSFWLRRAAELNLGVLRTETDLEQNNYRSFYETWQRLVPRNRHAFVADVKVNPNALVAGQSVGGVAAVVSTTATCNVEGS